MTASLSVLDLRFGQGDSQGWTFMILDCAPAPWVIGRFSSHKTHHAGLVGLGSWLMARLVDAGVVAIDPPIAPRET